MGISIDQKELHRLAGREMFLGKNQETEKMIVNGLFRDNDNPTFEEFEKRLFKTSNNAWI